MKKNAFLMAQSQAWNERCLLCSASLPLRKLAR